MFSYSVSVGCLEPSRQQHSVCIRDSAKAVCVCVRRRIETNELQVSKVRIHLHYGLFYFTLNLHRDPDVMDDNGIYLPYCPDKKEICQ